MSTANNTQVGGQHYKVKTIQAVNINDMLAGREARYGTFEGHARISQALKRAMHQAPRWASLADDQKESLEMVQHKIARVVNAKIQCHICQGKRFILIQKAHLPCRICNAWWVWRLI